MGTVAGVLGSVVVVVGSDDVPLELLLFYHLTVN